MSARIESPDETPAARTDGGEHVQGTAVPQATRPGHLPKSAVHRTGLRPGDGSAGGRRRRRGRSASGPGSATGFGPVEMTRVTVPLPSSMRAAARVDPDHAADGHGVRGLRDDVRRQPGVDHGGGRVGLELALEAGGDRDLRRVPRSVGAGASVGGRLASARRSASSWRRRSHARGTRTTAEYAGISKTFFMYDCHRNAGTDPPVTPCVLRRQLADVVDRDGALCGASCTCLAQRHLGDDVRREPDEPGRLLVLLACRSCRRSAGRAA